MISNPRTKFGSNRSTSVGDNGGQTDRQTDRVNYLIHLGKQRLNKRLIKRF